jgi:DNA-3-methyladenine glycosylase II
MPLDGSEAIARLTSLRGVGRWSAEYVLLRGLGRVHVFPGDDVGARNKLERFLDIAARLDYDGVEQIVARWHPFAGLVLPPVAGLALRGWPGDEPYSSASG